MDLTFLGTGGSVPTTKRNTRIHSPSYWVQRSCCSTAAKAPRGS